MKLKKFSLYVKSMNSGRLLKVKKSALAVDAWEPRFKRIIAHAFGKRDSEAFRELLKLLKPFTIRFFCTDNFSVYNSELPIEKHITDKIHIQHIERQNLNLRTRLKRLNRKTIGFSTCAEMHDKVIGTYFEREFY